MKDLKLIRTDGVLRGMRLQPAPDREFPPIPAELASHARIVDPESQTNPSLQITKVERRFPVDSAAQQEKRRRKAIRRRRKKAMYIAIQACMIALMLFALGKLGENLQRNVEGSEHRAMIQQMVFQATPEPVATPDRAVPEYPMATPERITYPQIMGLEQIQELKNINEDFQFWLYIPDTEINYYVMQAEDNAKYLWKGIYGWENGTGSCFLDFRNNGKTLEGHSIIYGHTMNDLSMFGALRDFMKESYFRSHPYMYTYSLDGVTKWQIFSVYNTTIDEYYIETYFSSDAEYLAFIEGLNYRSFFDTGIQLSADDDVLTLSTCYRPVGGERGRLTVHAVKVGTGPII